MTHHLHPAARGARLSLLPLVRDIRATDVATTDRHIVLDDGGIVRIGQERVDLRMILRRIVGDGVKLNPPSTSRALGYSFLPGAARFTDGTQHRVGAAF